MNSTREILSPIDYNSRLLPFKLILKYEDEIDELELKTYFEDLLKKFPRIAGEYEYEGNHGFLNDQKSLHITKKILDIEPELNDFLNIEQSKEVFPQSSNGGLNIQITEIRNPKVFYVTISVNHGICDANGLFDVILRKGSIPNCTDRSSLILRDSGEIWTREHAHLWGWQARTTKSFDLDDVVGDSFTFTKKQIDALREVVKNGKAPLTGRIISTNDILCAHMWKLSAIVRKEDSLDENFIFGEVINFRKHLGINENYYANAFTSGSVNGITRRVLIESDLSEIVLMIRNLADSFTKEVIQDTLRFLTKEYDNGTIDELGIPFDPQFGFFVTNWSKFNIYGNTAFCGHRATQIKVIFSFLVPWINVVLPNPQDEGGVVWLISYPTKYRERFRSRDVTVANYD